ncbi:hypothetical protein PR003_g18340 [Phytophthora rubi]|uniref:Uncharacterized protein n=1 Tax=Phytophthora rubi TaxID=129364 RepID=A0A6A3KBN9_9STRA|nr:hypothetical protein PR002_g17715 [Phytophthora rubi]KAE9003467.1 hypothetical protein PR001_g17968 [Phytophthora rubi]KAE9318024.1 hypothetical protein PR003_g18340 [Phytophthora rubi]
MSGSSAASSAPVGASSGQGGGSSQGFVAVNMPPSTVTSTGVSTVNLSAATSVIGSAAAGSAGLVGSYGLVGNPPPASMSTASMWPAPPSFGLTPSPLMAPPPQYSGSWYGMKMDNKAPVMQGSFDLYAEELKTFLVNLELWAVVEEAAAVRAIASDAQFCRMNNLARGAILRDVPKADAELICHEQIAQDMWKAFVDKQTKREYASYIFARQRLVANPFTPDRSMDDWLREMQLFRQELVHYKRGVSDEEFAEIILGNVVQTHRDVVRQFSRHYDPGYTTTTPSAAQVMNALRAE